MCQTSAGRSWGMRSPGIPLPSQQGRLRASQALLDRGGTALPASLTLSFEVAEPVVAEEPGFGVCLVAQLAVGIILAGPCEQPHTPPVSPGAHARRAKATNPPWSPPPPRPPRLGSSPCSPGTARPPRRTACCFPAPPSPQPETNHLHLPPLCYRQPPPGAGPIPFRPRPRAPQAPPPAPGAAIVAAGGAGGPQGGAGNNDSNGGGAGGEGRRPGGPTVQKSLLLPLPLWRGPPSGLGAGPEAAAPALPGAAWRRRRKGCPSRDEALLQQFAWSEALQSFLFALQWTIVTLFSTNVTIYHHLISQAGWNGCNLSIYLQKACRVLFCIDRTHQGPVRF